MKKLEINGFKAFGEPICLDFDTKEKSMVLYGENGSGKSSIYDAMLLAFHRSRLLAKTLTVGATPEQHDNEISDFYFSYRHRPLAGEIDIRIDGEPMDKCDTSRTLCFMLDCHAADCHEGRINLGEILGGMIQGVLADDEQIRQFVADNAVRMVDLCNASLEKRFIEAFRIGIEDADYNIYIEDVRQGLRSCVTLQKYFNEAKLHLVNLLLRLVAIRLMADVAGGDKKKMLVMDDVVTSLDSSNRSFLIHYLLAEFTDMQLLVMTHNIGFNNVFFNISKENCLQDKWHFANLYLNAGGPHLYDYTRMTTATGIKQAFERGELGLDNIGTIIRRRFEALLLEVTKILCVGASEDASTLVNRLLNPEKPIYLRKYHGKIYIADDLVSDIARKLTLPGASSGKLLKEISKEISRYNTEHSLGKLIPVIRQFREYEKLVLHELSHGYTAMPPFNQKEIEASLVLLEKMESCVKSLMVKNVGM